MKTHYFHCDQIGIPREMTDKDGNFAVVRRLLRLEQTKERNQGN
ncbi:MULTISPECIES: RHS domain-containing protein [unclassified Streptococcus]|nr:MULTISPECIES: RHS domain-containing protein [unclassified Streptococcus]